MTVILNQPPTINDQPPTMRGWVAATYRSYKGKRLGPYFVRRWKVGTKIHKEYIKPKEVERVKAACQAQRERRKSAQEITQYVSNAAGNIAYMERMFKWADQRKVRQIDAEFIDRLNKEGYGIPGRPPTRRKITRKAIRIGGKRHIVKTVYELDGTSRVFVVPFVAKCFTDPLEWFRNALDKAIESVRVDRKCETNPT